MSKLSGLIRQIAVLMGGSALGSGIPVTKPHVNIPLSKKGRTRGPRFRVKKIRSEDEAHLYGNKLARKAHRGVMTKQHF